MSVLNRVGASCYWDCAQRLELCRITPCYAGGFEPHCSHFVRAAVYHLGGSGISWTPVICWPRYRLHAHPVDVAGYPAAHTSGYILGFEAGNHHVCGSAQAIGRRAHNDNCRFLKPGAWRFPSCRLKKSVRFTQRAPLTG